MNSHTKLDTSTSRLTPNEIAVLRVLLGAYGDSLALRDIADQSGVAYHSLCSLMESLVPKITELRTGWKLRRDRSKPGAHWMVILAPGIADRQTATRALQTALGDR